ncbi:TPA: hypothetical protein CPT79_04160 [Candidatus Gastranaerophilales bacterium HUM_6]|nr:putative uncharacterized protein [Fusobacterium sp. CAG:815]DAA91305.1 MAG TPA: hypothetical protein CPT93_08335 [Candidatus Gastranaerophilales bacterium HUM_7]DAA91629.1 MAG TPA: hypothetical protein CPT79_04160 [Candidatus Gastranaerophilales bacterium HUM_6]DAB02982.1 MAG TPA: hypothetical protein CPT84_03230 [Candidatus Gastranaerophilales bacterium HUM_12]DAB06886.1 MAG TPA: hypothetical protein CPT78_04110 [Candidatus Gastranaerophilales bacterium HUM_14]
MKTQEKIVFKSNGWQTVNRLGLLNENYHTLILNYNELKSEIINIQKSTDPFLSLFNNKNLNRYIFNFLASTTALIDSCRNTMKFYKETDLYKTYEDDVKKLFARNKEAIFIKYLRNYMMHFKIIFPCLSDNNQVSFEVYQLNEFKGWTSLSKKFIQEQGKFVTIIPLIENYFKRLEPFYMEIYSKIREFHQEDFKETIKLASEIGMSLPNIYLKLADKA